MQWARGLPPPAQFRAADLDEDPEHALDLACQLEPCELGRLRAEGVLRVSQVSEELKEEQVAWAASAPEALQPLVSKLHGPLFQWLASAIDFPGAQLLAAWQSGFRLTGVLPPCPVVSTREVPKSALITESQLRDSL